MFDDFGVLAAVFDASQVAAMSFTKLTANGPAVHFILLSDGKKQTLRANSDEGHRTITWSGNGTMKWSLSVR